MNSKLSIIVVAILVLAALGTAFYLWKNGIPSTEPADGPGQTPEGTVNEDARPATTEDRIVGEWQSRDDAKFTRTFSANGSVTDRYEGNSDATVTGHWEIAEDRSILPGPLQNLDEETILVVEFPEEALFYVVLSATADELVLAYAGTNSTLRFKRI